MAWAPDYVDVEELKEFIRLTDDVDDAKIARAISAASRAVDGCARRQFGLLDAPEARVYTARYSPSRGRWVVDIDDLMTTAGLVVATAGAGGGVIAAPYGFRPRNAVAKGKPWTRLLIDPASSVQPTGSVDEVTVTARWGWTTVPPAVAQATLVQAVRFAKRSEAPFGVAGSPELGSEQRLLAKVDPDVEVALAGYRKRWIAA